MVYDIKGKIALITGGAAGIGLAYSIELLQNGLGGVVIADVNAATGEDTSAKLNEEYGAKKAVFIKTDVTKADQLEAAFQLAISTYGTLDIVINNAGVMNDAHWELEVAINCDFKNLLDVPSMLEQNTSLSAWTSRSERYYYNLTGIRFLTMCPGVTGTPLISEADKFALVGYPNLGKLLAEDLGSLPPQPTSNVAKGLYTMLTTGENGSVWVSEGGQPVYEVEIPDRNTLRKN
ncbi:hypothetical protein NQ314_000261 [Rhamnusium bicolor]|uniref:Uncharacterized protein n=1 Tax=Rhamnusium bicolor TaxID=1586634 RepID=A0AAV8ZV34_9CUCU|nr:hypothetical protein NQ314_000261 [Rhamnusium bicolor]